jgi:kumamolisin
MEALETVGTAAGMAVVLKTVLPEGGMAGKLAGAAIGAYFTYKAAEPIMHAYTQAGEATTLAQLDHASNQIGEAGGSFIVNSAIAALGYKAGSKITDRVLTSQSMDGFADAKANFYEKVGDFGTRITDNLGITSPETPFEIPIKGQKDARVKLGWSERPAPEGTVKGEIDPNTQMEVTVMLKSKASDLRMDRTLARIAQGRQNPLTETEFADHFGSNTESLSAVTKFAQDYGLKVGEADIRSGRVVLQGNVAGFSEAFGTTLAQYENAGVQFRGRVGALSVPEELAKHLVGIMGTDDRPQARANSLKFMDTHEGPPVDNPTPPAEPSGRRSQGYMPSEVADAYNFPKNTTGKGQGVGIIQLGGGIDLADNAAYYESRGLQKPNINVIEIGGAKNKPGIDSIADGEVVLDSQVIGNVAPGATQNLVFAPNSDKGFIDAITRLTFPEKGEAQNSVISISWGAPEELWTKQGMEGMSQAFKKAALRGITVLAASGDDGALDRAPSRRWQADFPASDPSVTGTGGTSLKIKDGKIESEVAWNNHRPNDAGGGGISEKFPPQDFQKDANVPINANKGGGPGRGVPDVAGNADPATGYTIRLYGKDIKMGGTSAVSPLYSGLTLRLNEALGKPVGYMNPWIYKNTGVFNDIVIGDNNAYKAGPGWDAVTGLGSIDGTKMLSALQSSPIVKPNAGEYRFVGPSSIDFIGPGEDHRRKH